MNRTNQSQTKKDSSLLVAVDKLGQVVLVKKVNHSRPLFRIPGGTVEEGETSLAALIREVWEETGMRFDENAPFALFSEWNDLRGHYYHVFGVVVSQFLGLYEHPVKDGADLLKVEVVDSREAIREGVMVWNHRDMLKKAIGIIAEKHT